MWTKLPNWTNFIAIVAWSRQHVVSLFENMEIVYENIARGTTDPGIASITWIFPATKLANSVVRKIQVKYFKIDFSGTWIGCITSKEAAAFEAASQNKEEFSGNDTSRHPKVFKLGPKLGYQ